MSDEDKAPVVSFEIAGKTIHLHTKFWLETEEGYIFGEGPFQLLHKISERGTLSGAASEMRMSYRHAWGVLKEIENKMGIGILKTHKGGTQGGGGAELTEEAKELVSRYLQLKEAYLETLRQITSENAGRDLGSRGTFGGRSLR